MDEQRELQQRKRHYQNNNKKENKTKGILELKKTMTELKNSVESFNLRLN